ncbi:MAG: hypothetical protein IKG08_10495 [Eubacterium sp.]|nr:hypothetical protein [Eubacterium sp.]
MKQYYVASLCREGVLGGGIVADDEGITYKTEKDGENYRFIVFSLKRFGALLSSKVKR